MSEQSPPYNGETMQQLAKLLTTPEPRKVIVPTVGVHFGIPEDTYHNLWDAASNSRLKLIKRSPAHMRTAIDLGSKETEAKRLGHAIHAAILEPDSFTSRFIVAGQCEATKKGDGLRCTNNGSILSAKLGWLCGTHSKGSGPSDATRTVLPSDEYEKCMKIRDSVHAHPSAHQLLTFEGQSELSLVWVDPDTGLLCKARVDRQTGLIPGGAFADVKSTIDASKDAFALAIYKYWYHTQGAHYLEGAAVLDLPVRHFVNIAVEKEPPYAVGLYRLREDAILAGANQLRPLKLLYARCLETGKWPAYSEDVEDIALPEWAARRIDEDTRELTIGEEI